MPVSFGGIEGGGHVSPQLHLLESFPSHLLSRSPKTEEVVVNLLNFIDIDNSRLYLNKNFCNSLECNEILKNW